MSVDIQEYLINHSATDVLETAALADNYDISRQILRIKTQRNKVTRKSKSWQCKSAIKSRRHSPVVTSRKYVKETPDPKSVTVVRQKSGTEKRKVTCTYYKNTGYSREYCYALERDVRRKSRGARPYTSRCNKNTKNLTRLTLQIRRRILRPDDLSQKPYP